MRLLILIFSLLTLGISSAFAECQWEVEVYDYLTKKTEKIIPEGKQPIVIPLDPKVARCYINPVTVLEEDAESLLVQCTYPDVKKRGFELGVIANPDVPGRGALGIYSDITRGRRYRIFVVGGNCSGGGWLW